MMKKVYLFLVPIVSYILAYFITDLETLIPLYSGSVLKIYVLKYCFFILLGIFVCFFSRNLTVTLRNTLTVILCLAAILVPIVLWIYLIKNNYVGNFDNYFLVYFIYLGGYFNAAFVHLFQKGDTL